ncbi:hypothetical protein O9H85_16900 [Paenibacillus filicis]|uniref:Uncharacterized protein n=1 Tax=Paenibacillus gyeongsangnamensis TaxID=3388067 RepID=A0ABT4QBE2_9BACL|nr:hypothetical protein [Paenibacillus filicis]MCZ8514072.1 hypothetical protein [Paenibacillus filicis]
MPLVRPLGMGMGFIITSSYFLFASKKTEGKLLIVLSFIFAFSKRIHDSFYNNPDHEQGQE